jgi:signal peptidase I
MIRYFAQRKARKQAYELLRHAVHVRHMREDVAKPEDIAALRAAELALGEACARGGDRQALGARREALGACLERVSPPRPAPGLRENLEVAVVAISIAMACRAYFLQPFKIPTGSMQPTLYGITSVEQAAPRLTDRYPFKPVRWFLTGEWYTVVRARTDGTLVDNQATRGQTPPFVVIAGVKHKVPGHARLNVASGAFVKKGTLLWSGVVTAGDHVFVDRVRWNVTRPKRGQIMVFNTHAIASLPQGTHYIKRLSALPGETVSIHPPELLVNGFPVLEPDVMRRIAEQRDGYAGYYPAGAYRDAILRFPGDRLELGPTEYCALGDNTQNSRDSRFWGGVPRQNLVGPALFVYWPFFGSNNARGSNWGRAR